MARKNSTHVWPGKATRSLALVLLVAACSGSGNDPGTATLRVLAAASMREAVLKAAEHQSVLVSLSDGASGTLARQIMDGAPADVFISASPDWMAQVGKAGKLHGKPVLLARNELVIAVAREAEFPSESLGEFLVHADMVAMADEKAPAGKYARQVLAKLNAPATLKIVGQDDVRGVLRAVQTGNVPAGFVYRSDVMTFADTLRVLFAIDGALHDPIEIHGAVLADSRQPAAARKFLEFFGSDDGVATLQSLGFKAP